VRCAYGALSSRGLALTGAGATRIRGTAPAAVSRLPRPPGDPLVDVLSDVICVLRRTTIRSRPRTRPPALISSLRRPWAHKHPLRRGLRRPGGPPRPVFGPGADRAPPESSPRPQLRPEPAVAGGAKAEARAAISCTEEGSGRGLVCARDGHSGAGTGCTGHAAERRVHRGPKTTRTKRRWGRAHAHTDPACAVRPRRPARGCIPHPFRPAVRPQVDREDGMRGPHGSFICGRTSRGTRGRGSSLRQARNTHGGLLYPVDEASSENKRPHTDATRLVSARYEKTTSGLTRAFSTECKEICRSR
jgi:hypothetical protein